MERSDMAAAAFSRRDVRGRTKLPEGHGPMTAQPGRSRSRGHARRRERDGCLCAYAVAQTPYGGPCPTINETPPTGSRCDGNPRGMGGLALGRPRARAA